MTSTILLNLILCSAVFVAVAAPLMWAILTTQRDEPVRVANARPDDDLMLARSPWRPRTPPQPLQTARSAVKPCSHSNAARVPNPCTG